MAGLLRKVLSFHALDHETKVSIFLRFIISVFVVCVSGDYFSPESLGRPMARNLNVASDGRKHIGCRSVYYTLVFMKIYLHTLSYLFWLLDDGSLIQSIVEIG